MMDLATAHSSIDTSAETVERLLEIDRKNVLHSWGPQTSYEPRIIVGADGCYYWDTDGRRFLDFISQAFYANIGHGETRVTDAMAAQARQLASVYSHGTIAKSLLAEKVLSLFPSSYDRIYFGSNGADAVELALKVARLTTGRQNVIAFWDGYHGASMGATSATAEHRGRLGSGELVPGTFLAPTPYHYRSQLRGNDQEETDERTVAFIRHMIEQVGPETIAAVLGEPYVTAGPGVIPGPTYWKHIRALCDDYGIILVSDEMISGFGRSGHWFARDWYDYEPDIICLGKGLSGGYAPISATVIKADLVARFEDLPLPYGLTFAGHAVSCAAALANIEVLESDDLVARSAAMSKQLERALGELQQRHVCIGEIRMIGMFINIELVSDHATKRAFPSDASLAGRHERGPGVGVDIGRRLRDSGVIIRALPDIIKLGPPLVISWDDVHLGLEQLDTALDAADELCG